MVPHTEGEKGLKFKRYKIPYGTEVEIINKDSRYFMRKGVLVTTTPEETRYMIDFGNKTVESFGWNEFLPVKNILKIPNLSPETLSQIFDPNYLYETNKVVVYLGNFTYEEVGEAYKELARNLVDGNRVCDKAEYVLALLDNMCGYDEEELETPIDEMIMFVQWWVEGLRKHVTNGTKKRRYFETECFEIEFIRLDELEEEK